MVFLLTVLFAIGTRWRVSMSFAVIGSLSFVEKVFKHAMEVHICLMGDVFPFHVRISEVLLGSKEA